MKKSTSKPKRPANKRASGGLSAPPCSALDAIRQQIGRLKTHARVAYPGDPTPEQCKILALELTIALQKLEAERW